MYETIKFTEFSRLSIDEIDKKLDDLVFMVVRGSVDLATYINNGEFKSELGKAKEYSKTKLFNIINWHLIDQSNNKDEIYFDQFVRFRETFGSIHVGTHYDAHEQLPLESINFWVPGVDLKARECLIFTEKPLYEITENLAGTNKPGLIFSNKKIAPDYEALGKLLQVELKRGDFLMFKGGKTLHMSPDTNNYRMSVDQRIFYKQDKNYSGLSCTLMSHFMNNSGDKLQIKENDCDDQFITYDPRLLANLILKDHCLAFEINGINCSRSVEVMLEILSNQNFTASNLRKVALENLTTLSPENPKKVMQTVTNNTKLYEIILFYFYLFKHQGFGYLMTWILCTVCYSRFGGYIERSMNAAFASKLAFKLRVKSYKKQYVVGHYEN